MSYLIPISNLSHWSALCSSSGVWLTHSLSTYPYMEPTSSFNFIQLFFILVYIEVYGNTIRTFRIVHYIAGVRHWGVSVKRGSTVLIPRISAHPPILAQCKVHHPWALFHEGTVYEISCCTCWYCIMGNFQGIQFSLIIHIHRCQKHFECEGAKMYDIQSVYNACMQSFKPHPLINGTMFVKLRVKQRWTTGKNSQFQGE